MNRRTCLESVAAVIALSGLLPTNAYGMIAPMGGEELLKQADVVARIRIIDVAEHPGPQIGTLANRKISQFEIVESIKGPAAKTIFRIEHGNSGAACPIVVYEANGEYLVFARKVPGTDRYVTLNYSEGNYRIQKGVIEGYYIFGEKPPQQFKKAEAVVAELHERLKKVPKK
jgi:hypothetical protein